MGTASLAIVEIYGKYYLIGLSEKHVQLVRELEDFSEEEPTVQKAPFSRLFAEILEKARRNNSNIKSDNNESASNEETP